MESIRENQLDLRYQRSGEVSSTQAIGIHRAAIDGNPVNPPGQRSIQEEPRTRGGASIKDVIGAASIAGHLIPQELRR